MKLNVDLSALAKSVGIIDEKSEEMRKAMLVANKQFKELYSSNALKLMEEIIKQNQENVRKMTKAMEGINKITVPAIKINWQMPIVDLKPIIESGSLMKSMELLSRNSSNYSNLMKVYSENITESQRKVMANLTQALSENKTIRLDEIINSIEENELNEFNELIGDSESFEEDINSVIINEELNWQQKIIELIKAFTKKNPIIAILIFFTFLAPIKANMENILQGAYENAIENIGVRGISKENQKELKKQVINNITIINSDYKESILNSYKIVLKENLEIRQNNAMKSEVIHRLSYGEIVEVVWKNKKWTLIQYQDDNKIIEGWVLTRYIERLD